MENTEEKVMTIDEFAELLRDHREALRGMTRADIDTLIEAAIKDEPPS